MKIKPHAPMQDISTMDIVDTMHLDSAGSGANTGFVGSTGDDGECGSVDDIRQAAAVRIQAAFRGFCARKNLSPTVRERIGSVRKACYELHHLLDGMQRRITDSFYNHLLDRDQWVDSLERIQEVTRSYISVRQDVSDFLDKVSTKAKVIELDTTLPTRVEGLKANVVELGREVGFQDLKSALCSVLGGGWRQGLSEAAQRQVEFYHRIFSPTGYTIVPVLENNGERAILGSPDTLVQQCEDKGVTSMEVEDGADGALTETHPNFFHNLPYVKEVTWHEINGPYEELNAAELCLPYQDEGGQPRILVIKGNFANDPINIQYAVGVLEQKKAKYVEAANQLDTVPEVFKKGFLVQYSVRDFLLNTPQDYSRELQAAYDLYKEMAKEKIFAKIVKRFKQAEFTQQVLMITVLVLGEERARSQQLFAQFLHLERKYENLVRRSLHFSILRVLKGWEEKFEDMRRSLEKVQVKDLDYREQIITCMADDEAKARALGKLRGSKEGGKDGAKSMQWLDGFLKLPWGKFSPQEVTLKDGKKVIADHLKRIRDTLDEAVYGQEEAKEKIMEVMGQWVANGGAKGIAIGLQGPPGNGKTTFAKEGLAKALGRPFVFIGLGGANSSVYLQGDDYMWVGSSPGKIVEGLQKAGVMNPIIYIDELDKVSGTERGKEIIGVLTHLIDFTQNDCFEDHYYKNIPLDLSRCLFVFSYNNEKVIDRILKDRMETIRTKGLTPQEKLVIAQKYLLPSILESVNIEEGNIIIEDDVVRHIIDNYTIEAGVRRLKEALFSICRQINLERLLDEDHEFPITVDKAKVTKCLKEPKISWEKVAPRPQVGTVNGMWASAAGVGGINIIQTFKQPSDTRLKLELTGSQGKVMQESMKTARTVAWNVLPDEIQDKISEEKTFGLHIHVPDTAGQKDGPSGGGAIVTSIVSRLTGIPVRNDVAMTGEVCLEGRIREIGGLEYKLQGAKRAGAKTVFIPKENHSDIADIEKRFPGLIDDDLKVVEVETIQELLGHVLMPNDIEFQELV